MSSLTENLSYIYSIKQEIKEVIGTNSDLFSEYPDLISDKLNEAIDWDDVATAGYIIPAGTITIDDNGSSIDVASYAYANVQVSGGSGSSIDPWYGESLDPTTAVGNEEFPLTADITRASITGDFTVNKTPNDAVESVEWLYQFYDTNNNLVTIKYIVETSHDLDGNDTGEIEVADRIAQSLEDYPDLYDILPSLTEVTMTQSSDPKTDGYDYLIEGNLYTWNLMNNTGEVMTITENGFVLSDGYLGYDVNVPIDWDEVASYSYIVPSGTITIGDKEIGNTVDVSAYANAYIDIQGGGGSAERVTLYNINYITNDDTTGSLYKVLWDGIKLNYDPVEYGTPIPLSYILSETITDKFDAGNPETNDSYLGLNIYEYDSGAQGQLLYAYTAVNTYTFLTNGDATGHALIGAGSTIATPDPNEQSAWSFNGLASTPEYTMIYFDNNTLQSDTEVCFYSYAFIYDGMDWIVDENASSGEVYDTNFALCVATIPANTNWILIKWSADYSNTIEKIMKRSEVGGGWAMNVAGIWEELETMQPGGGGY